MTDNTLGEKQDNYSATLLQARINSNFITIPQTTIDYKELHKQLTEYTHTKYLLTKLEQHKDEGRHIHIVIRLSKTIRITAIHNIIMSQPGAITGLINYQKPDKINATIQYLKKEETSVADEPYLEHGDKPLEQGRPLKQYNIIQLAQEGDIEGAIEQVKIEMTKEYLIHKQTIDSNIEAIAKPKKKKYIAPSFNKEDITLTEQQHQVWNLLQYTPIPRRIIWVTGHYGSGKTFLYNYIKANHEYDVYDAGQSSSMDNVVYGYNEEGVISWDLPRTFNFNDYGDAIANIIEKFSDFGQTITSKKYSGKQCQVLGHVIVFSNHEPLEQLKHRNIVHIHLGEKPDKEDKEDKEEKPDKHQFSDSTYDSEDDTPQLIKARIMTYANRTAYLEHPQHQHCKNFRDIGEANEYIINHNLVNTLDNHSKKKLLYRPTDTA